MADEANPTGSESEVNPTDAGATATGGTSDGGAVTTTPAATGDAFAAERERYEKQIRDFQALKDREASRRAELERELASVKQGSEPEADKPLTRAELLRTLAERDRQVELSRAAATLRASDDFKFADASIFDKADQFDSPEALKAAAQASHEAVKAIIDKEAESKVSEALEEAAKRYGFQLQQAPASTPVVPSGDPTMEQLAAMPMSEFSKVPQEVVDRVMRNATTVTT